MHPDRKEQNPAESTVHIYMGDIEIQHLPEHIELSPEGIRFRSHAPLEAYSVVELTMEVPEASSGQTGGTITCAGLVLDCQEELSNPDLPYSVLVKFLSIPKTSHRHIEHTASRNDMKCPFRQAS